MFLLRLITELKPKLDERVESGESRENERVESGESREWREFLNSNLK